MVKIPIEHLMSLDQNKNPFSLILREGEAVSNPQ